MAKRSKDTLTGGTHDVNPQYLQGRVTLSAANTATEVVLGTPIVRVGPQTGGNAIIMEILKVFVQMPQVDADAAAATARNFQIAFGTTSSGTTASVRALDDPRIFAWLSTDTRNAFTAAGTGLLAWQEDPRVFNATDDAGHGILVATDNIFVTATSTGQAGADIFPFKILYRFKKVSLVEYIGIVQSQQ